MFKIRGYKSTINAQSVIASDVEKCCSTPPQFGPNLQNRACMSKPEAEHRTLSVGKY